MLRDHRSLGIVWFSSLSGGPTGSRVCAWLGFGHERCQGVGGLMHGLCANCEMVHGSPVGSLRGLVLVWFGLVWAGYG